jgi:hypothetical protein
VQRPVGSGHDRQKGRQFVRHVDMPGQERGPVRQLASFERAQVIGNDLVDASVFGRAARIRCGHDYFSALLTAQWGDF